MAKIVTHKHGLQKESFNVALLGAETLLGHDIQEVLEARVAGVRIAPFAATGEGNFGAQEGEAVFVEPLDAQTTRDDHVIVIAGTVEGALKAYGLAKASRRRLKIIDGTGHLENQPDARILAPLVGDVEVGNSWLLVIAHPAASAVALTLLRLARAHALASCVAHIFEPASERGKTGAAELHQQTTSLLAFKPLDKAVFDAQLSFNVLPRYGEDAPVSLGSVEQRIERDVATILASEIPRPFKGKPVPLPSIRVVQAPVFHGYSISLWVEFAAAVPLSDIGEALASSQIEVRAADQEAPDSIGAAGQSGLIAGDIRMDRNNPRAAWIWLVCDNLRIVADSTADLLKTMQGGNA